MNEMRRKQIAEALDKIREGLEELETAKADEEAYLDNMPESLRGGEKANKSEQAVSNLDDACSDIENAISTAEEALE